MSDTPDDGAGEQRIEEWTGGATDGIKAAVTSTYKVLGEIDAPTGVGVLGHNTATSGQSRGVIGVADSPDDATGVLGRAPAGEADGVIGIANNGGIGVGALTDSASQPGMLALNTAASGQANGLKATTDSSGDGSAAVVGEATQGSGQTFGVFGTTASPSGYGLATPDDTRIEGILDTGETDFVMQAGTQSTGDARNVVHGHASNQATSGVVGGVVGGGGLDDGSTVQPNEVYDNYGTIGGGQANQAGSADGDHMTSRYATVGGGNNNTASGEQATIGGGQFNEASDERATVGGGTRNTASGQDATVGGGNNNTASGTNSTVGGGNANTASDERATVGGGARNTASGNGATVGGGDDNTASKFYATIGGGQLNEASDERATVGGGTRNTAGGNGATVGGGGRNTAGGNGATVGGGGRNTASGRYAAVPGGKRGAAESGRSYVWNDGSSYHDVPNADFDGLSSDTAVAGEPVTGARTFSVSAQGGVRFITGSDSVTYIPGGSAGWATMSMRAAKTNIDPVDPRRVLDGVDELDVAIWEYKADDGDGQGTTHIGPMAEDFHEIVNVGSSDEHINHINADGVLFAAVQGLSEKLDEKAERIDDLEAENEQLRDRLATIEADLGLSEAEPDAAPDDD